MKQRLSGNFLKQVMSANPAFGFGTVGAYTCKAMQASLESYFGRNIALYRTGATIALLRWLLSPQNTANYQKLDVTAVPGKKRPVVFRVQDPYCFNLCQTDLTCTDTPVMIDHNTKEVVFDMTGEPFRHCDGQGNPVVLRFSEDDLRKYCEKGDQSIINDDMSRYLLQFEAAFSKALSAVFATKVGSNEKNETLTNIRLWLQNATTSAEALNPNAIWQLSQLFQNLGVEASNYAMIGGAQVSKIAQFKNWATANDLGIDMSKQSTLNPYMFYDRNVENVLGVEDMILAAPGVAQLITWNKYKGEYARKVTELYTHGTVALPTTGLEVDFKWTYDYSCEVWIFECFLHAELVTVPAGGCNNGASQNFTNVNGMIRVHDCSGVPLISPCPEA